MRNALLVAAREYADNARTKGFWIGILALPILLVIAVRVPSFLEKNATPTRNFILLDRTGELESIIDRELERAHQRQVIEELSAYGRKYLQMPGGQGSPNWEDLPAVNLEDLIAKFAERNPEVVDQFIASGGVKTALASMAGMLKEGAPEFEEPRLKFCRVSLPEGIDSALTGRDLADALAPWLKGEETLSIGEDQEELFALVEIPADILASGGETPFWESSGPQVKFWAINLADSDLRKSLERALDQEFHQREFQRLGVDSETVRKVQSASVPLASLDPRKEVGEEEVSMADKIRQYAPIGFVYFLWIAIMQVASMLLNNTIEEKSNRIIEVLLSSVTPWELMMGKLLGIAGIGFTLVTAWILSMLGILWFSSGPEAEIATRLLEVVSSGGLLLSFAMYFVLGYFLYASIFLAMGSVCNTLKEAQNLMGPVMMIMMVPLLTMMFIPKDPNGSLATFLSWVPIYTPFIMMNRAAADPPMFDLIGTTVLLIATNLGMLWFCGRIFRIGILRTGQPPKFRELFQWVKTDH